MVMRIPARIGSSILGRCLGIGSAGFSVVFCQRSMGKEANVASDFLNTQPSSTASDARNPQSTYVHYSMILHKYKEILPKAYQFSQQLCYEDYTLERVQSEIMLVRSSPKNFSIFQSQAIKPSFLSFVPLGSYVYSPTKLFVSELCYLKWLDLMKMAMDLNALSGHSMTIALLGLYRMSLTAPRTDMDHATWSYMERMFMYALDRCTFDNEYPSSHCHCFTEIVSRFPSMFLRFAFATPFSVESLDTPVLERLIERLPAFCQCSIQLIRNDDPAIAYLIRDLIRVLLTVSKQLHQPTNELVQWEWLKSIAEDNNCSMPDSLNELKNKIPISFANLSAHWSVDDRAFWTKWLTSNPWLEDVQLENLNRMRWLSTAIATAIEVLLKCHQTNTLGIIGIEQKRELIEYFSRMIKFLPVFEIKYLKILVNLHKQNVSSDASVFDECDLVKLLNILNAYNPVKIERRTRPE